MNLLVNGKNTDITDALTISELLAREDVKMPQMVSVELNGQILKRILLQKGKEGMLFIQRKAAHQKPQLPVHAFFGFSYLFECSSCHGLHPLGKRSHSCITRYC